MKNFKSFSTDLRDFFHVARYSWPVLIIQGLTFILSGNDQLRDIMVNIHEIAQKSMPRLTVILFIWSYLTWYSCRVIFYMTGFTPRDEKNKLYLEHLQRWIARALGMSPVIIFWMRSIGFGVYDSSQLWFIIPLALYIMTVIFRRDIYDWVKSHLKWNIRALKPLPIMTAEISLRRIRRLSPSAFYFPGILFLLFIAVFLISRYSLPVYFTPLGILFIGMIVWTGFLFYIIVYEKKLKLPVTILVLILVYFFSYYNNNHLIRSIGNQVRKDDHTLVTCHFNAWQKERTRKNVILIAAEGGGIRAAYWTALVLTLLHDHLDGFSDQVYAISSVSGGSLGAGTFDALLRIADPGDDDLTSKARAFLGKDYLSPLLCGMIFPNTLQWLLPYPIPALDRARYLEYSWEYGWDETFPERDASSNIFRNPFMDFWDRDHAFAPPSLILNGTHVESGRPVATSNLSWPDTWDIEDIIGLREQDIPFSSAILLSARFPLVTPSGLIRDAGNKNWGHVADGGYFDNSGLNALGKLYLELRNDIETRHDSCRFLIISIKNSTIKEKADPLTGQYETRTPIDAFYNAWEARSYNEVTNIKKLVDYLNNSGLTDDMFMEINLPRSEDEILPLGWYLSKKASIIIYGHAVEVIAGKEQKIKEFLQK